MLGHVYIRRKKIINKYLFPCLFLSNGVKQISVNYIYHQIYFHFFSFIYNIVNNYKHYFIAL